MANFAEDIIEELLDRTSKGEQLTKLCSDTRMPSRASVYSWLDSDPEFAGRFRAARARGVHALAEECLDIADEKAADAVQVADKRVRIDTRLRLAGKWLASEYGDRVAVSHSGEVVTRHDFSGYSAEDLDALERLVAKGADASGDTSGESPARTSSVH